MLGSVKAAGGADWCILIMDAVTTRVMSRAARISEILDFGVSREALLPARLSQAEKLLTSGTLAQGTGHRACCWVTQHPTAHHPWPCTICGLDCQLHAGKAADPQSPR